MDLVKNANFPAAVVNSFGMFGVTPVSMGVLTYGANGVSRPPWKKWMKKLKSENMQKNSSFLRLCYILTAIKAGRCRERRYAGHIFILQNAPFRTQIFTIFFASGSKGALTALNQNPADVPASE